MANKSIWELAAEMAETAQAEKNQGKPEVKSLRRWMAERGLTIRGLATKAQELGYHTNAGTVSRILNFGEYKAARAVTMRAIAESLGLEITQVAEFAAAIENQLAHEAKPTVGATAVLPLD